MREQNCTSASIRFQTSQNMLEESIVCTALRRCAEEITAILVIFKGTTIPLADGLRRIGQHKIKLLDCAFFNESGTLQRIIVGNVEIIDAMEE